jgi:hypothetical protein
MLGHEAANASNRRVLSKTSDLAVTLHAVVLETLQRNGLAGSLNLLGLGVDLLLTLLASSTQPQDQMQGALLLDVIVAESPAVFQLLTGKDQTLLIRRNTFLVLDLGLDILNRVSRLDIESDSLTRQGLDEDLHGDIFMLCYYATNNHNNNRTCLLMSSDEKRGTASCRGDFSNAVTFLCVREDLRWEVLVLI